MVSAYSISVNEQYNFEKNQMLIAFSDIDTSNENRVITISGSLPYADSVKLKANNFPIIGKIIRVIMKENWSWGDYFLKNLWKIKNKSQYKTGWRDYDGISSKIIASKCNMKLTKESLYFNVYESDEAILLDFKKDSCNK